MKFKTSGVCSRAIDFDVVDGKVVNVHFTGGCAGKTQGVAALIEGMDIDDWFARQTNTHSTSAISSARFSFSPALKDWSPYLRAMTRASSPTSSVRMAMLVSSLK